MVAHTYTPGQSEYTVKGSTLWDLRYLITSATDEQLMLGGL
jgi:hypothetical protein